MWTAINISEEKTTRVNIIKELLGHRSIQIKANGKNIIIATRIPIPNRETLKNSFLTLKNRAANKTPSS